MQPTDWETLQTVFEKASALSGQQREQFLLAQDISRDLLAEVRDLLGADATNNVLQLEPNHFPITMTTTNGGERVSSVHELEEGFLISHYRIEKKIGMGGMGVIYRAMDVRLDRQIALKFLLRYSQKDELAKRRFMVEARSASQLDHQNICAIYDISTIDDDYVYLIMPYYQGETLADRMSNGTLDVSEALEITIQISNGLVCAHALDIVHRDIKPANIMLTHEGRVKILDFGIAKMSDVNLTATGDVIGTVAYMAPEQLKGERADSRVDVWALGLTFLEMLTGTRRFSSKKIQLNIKEILDKNFSPLDELPDTVNNDVRQVISTALQQDQNKRYCSMQDFRKNLIQTRDSLDNIKNKPTTEKEIVTDSQKNNNVMNWDDNFIEQLTQCLLPLMGPISTKLVQRYTKKSSTLDELYQHLLDSLPDDSIKDSFKTTFKKIVSKNFKEK